MNLSSGFVINRVLLTKFRHHGDFLLTSPLFSILRQYYLDVQIDALVYGETTKHVIENFRGYWISWLEGISVRNYLL